MRVWLILACGGLITFGIRFSFIYLFGKITVPEPLRKALFYVPPAVLMAIILPELLMPSGSLILDVRNPRLLAGLVAALVAWFGRKSLLTILAGMGAFFLFRYLFG